MSGVSAAGVSQSVNALNQIMEMATQESLDMAKKLMKVAVQESVGAEQGKGGSVDTTG
jgi:hypothetical protein